MKRPSFFLLIILFVIFTACSKPVKEQLIGKWQLSKVGNETLSASDTDASIEFTKEGKMIFIVDGDSSISKWELNKEENAIIQSNAKNEKKNWNIVSISKHRLVYTEQNDTSKITLTK
jgi:hypothetical protein